ncbi:MAG: YicC family protein [Eubacteriales bacterium]|nr:YicC family protein [Eubacteriales bacterium]
MPISSMTGFGRGAAQENGRKLMIELKSVNHRFLDIGMRLPRVFGPHEDYIRKTLQSRLTRGHVDVYIKYENQAEGSKRVAVDEALMRAYLDAAGALERTFFLENDMRISHALRLPDVLTCEEEPEDEDALREVLSRALCEALDGITALRREEGARLRTDLLGKIAAMRAQLDIITGRAPCIVEEYREKLTQRVEELLGSAGVDEGRLAAEVVLFADRSCIDEEIVRLGSHMQQFEKMLDADTAVGRQLDFLVQEMNREVNTICSKSVDSQITSAGLVLKNEIEKIREQVQNIE